MMQAKGDFLVDGVGVKRPAETPVDALTVGEVGYVVTGLKDPEAVRVGDTLPGRRTPVPSRFPVTARLSPWSIRACSRSITDYESLRDALDKLHVNDPVVVGARDLGGARLWLPRGLPGPAAYGGRQGAPRA